MHKCVRVKLVEASLAEKDREERCDQGFRRPITGMELAAPPITALEIVPTCRLRGWRGSVFLAHGAWTSATKYLFVLLYFLCSFPLPIVHSLPRPGKPSTTSSTRTLSLFRVISASVYPWYAPITMSLQRPLRGHCACRRNQYYIRAPQGVSDVAQVIFSTGESHSTLAI